MSRSRKKESKHSRDSQFSMKVSCLESYSPTVIEHGKKFAAYDKNGTINYFRV